MTSTTASYPTQRAIFVESATGHPAKFPERRWARWVLRVAIAVPFVLLAVVFQARGGSWPRTANGALEARVTGLAWDSTDVAGLRQLYPPISSFLALLTPGGAIGLAVVGSLLGGILVQLVLQSMRRKEFPPAVRLAYLLALTTTPVFAFVVTTNLEATLGLLFFGVGMIDLVRFVTYANTQAGFRAGLLFAASVLSDRIGLFTIVAAAYTSLLIIHSRPGSRRANVLVVMFPTVALVGAFMALGAGFRVGAVTAVAGYPAWDADRAAQVGHFLQTGEGLVYLAPAVIVIVAAAALRHPWVGIVGIILTGMPLLAFVLGLAPPGTAGTTYLLMLMFAAAVAPQTTTRLTSALVVVLAGVLWVLGWLTVLVNPTMHLWLTVVTRGGAA
ncbi:membrane hypothetical protein [Nostocoides japonicum T1-X7]|uniref:Uncharacterized protein n=1 Tax=Nostocoides japonicum T1-X7 TaxID=1194083 RepID=A0A077LXE6_9MICO|nr:hypothetical protein [Tetrasphaera japonica]CCH78578.1 membrane hypothetical protein [Tetrasphaera japonica T1-X7]CCH79363.1 membrane hypothetical protein [Tetrasphaera japonica T1-X7]